MLHNIFHFYLSSSAWPDEGKKRAENPIPNQGVKSNFLLKNPTFKS